MIEIVHVLLSLFILSLIVGICAVFRPARLALVLGACFLLLAACGTAPVTVDRTIEVKVPVPVPCKVQAVPVPEWPTEHLPPGASDFDFYKAALSELLMRKGYEARLIVAGFACSVSP
ncbi:hypothetical protein [Burkholderia phage BCSR129]|nr:hypothetical protein [Burkholderia phage BCSR129]